MAKLKLYYSYHYLSKKKFPFTFIDKLHVSVMSPKLSTRPKNCKNHQISNFNCTVNPKVQKLITYKKVYKNHKIAINTVFPKSA